MRMTYSLNSWLLCLIKTVNLEVFADRTFMFSQNVFREKNCGMLHLHSENDPNWRYNSVMCFLWWQKWYIEVTHAHSSLFLCWIFIIITWIDLATQWYRLSISNVLIKCWRSLAGRIIYKRKQSINIRHFFCQHCLFPEIYNRIIKRIRIL